MRAAGALLLLALTGACAHGGPAGEVPVGPATSPAATPAEGATGAASPGAAREEEGEVDALLRSHLPEVTRCYELLLKEAPEYGGRFLLTLDVAPGGELEGLTFTSETSDPAPLEGCLRASFEGLRFPPSEAGFLLEVPFSFAPKIVEPEPEGEGEATPSPPPAG
ncbi:MAG: AgmX/PglI C-terminal domain-containing protein [Deltaproteobacteria bacterium]|nr:AgmX/PglI C-terminal domain-containing protein [Deltaproteobacteria bacterium]